MSAFDIKRFFPFLNWPRPTLSSLKSDAWAGFSVGLVLIPQAVAYATLAGMPAATGLYAALIPTLVGVLWGSSALLAVGPAALSSLLVFGSLSSHAVPASAQWVALAVWLSIYSGLFQFLLGAFRLGRLSNLVSQPVIVGFINAAALIIMASQIPTLIGVPDLFTRSPDVVLERIAADPSHLLMTSAFGFGALLLLWATKKFFPRFPGILLVTVLATFLSWALGYAPAGGEVVGDIARGLPPLVLPTAISFEMHRELWSAGLVLALISFTEAMSSCRVLARKRRERWDENQELIGQGLAKVASGFSGAFPVSGSFSRSALNLYAGATSAWATLFTLLCVLLCLLFFTDLLFYVPRTVLAAMIIMPVFSLFDFGAFKRLYLIAKDDAAIALVTFLVTIVAMPRLHWGVVAGIGLTMVCYLYRHMQPRIIEVSEHKDGTLRDSRRFDLPRLADDLIAVRIDAALNFLTGAALERFVTEQISESQQIRRVLLCVGSVNDIDATGVDTLESMQAALKGMGVDLYVTAIKKQVWDVLDDAGWIAILGSDHIFMTDREAIAALADPAHARS
ncbi:SulP family inorganic anion transporter [Oxalicibacterium faecigallinarum]|uniref:Sodium-independent anion transporter n=1 Tax=Oxalicibacterium faecigallinarum TaxID=573741 RepID=A0A8J3AYM1_9BURK|nr:SulP family inorganic anion transporter [Oxalicibacterium faecigallinarum]GGI18988.1 sodium-independent anion transporter [Oxalicibacterium faecigallinarum]